MPWTCPGGRRRLPPSQSGPGRERYEDDFRLLDDIGWNSLDGRDSYRLTMPDAQRERLFRRMLNGAEECLRDYAADLRAAARDRTGDRPPDMTPEEWAYILKEDDRILRTINADCADRCLELRTICRAVLGEDGTS